METSTNTAIVIGRGIAGLSAALELLRGGKIVTVVGPSRDDEMGSRAAVGLTSLKGAVTASNPLFTLKKLGHEGLRSWLAGVEKAAARKIPQMWFGSTEVFFDLTEYEGIRHRVFHRKFTGAHRAQCLRAEDLWRFGCISKSMLGTIAGGFHYSDAGWFDPRIGLDVLEQAIQKLGGRIFDAVVSAIAGGPAGSLTVHTSRGILTGFDVILAAGHASNAILDKSVQYEVASRLIQVAVVGETLHSAQKFDVSDGLVQLKKATLAVIDGALSFGSTCYVLPPANDDRAVARASALAALHAKAARLAIPNLALSHSSWGARGKSPDRLPLFGRLSLPGSKREFWIVAGLYKSGLQLSHLFARELRRILCENAPSRQFAPVAPSFESFRPERFL